MACFTSHRGPTGSSLSKSSCSAVLICGLLLALHIAGVTATDTPPKRVAVIGAGPAGSSFAYFYANAFPNATIDVFEASDRAGGRCHSEELAVSKGFGKIMVEWGASIFVEENQNLMRAVREFNLTLQSFGDSKSKHRANHQMSFTSQTSHLGLDYSLYETTNGSEAAAAAASISPRLAIWDGKSVRFDMDMESNWRSQLRGMRRYGFSPVLIARYADQAAARLASIYHSNHPAYTSIPELAQALRLYEYAQIYADKYLARNGSSFLGQRYIDEIVEGVTRTNYGRNLNEVHSLAMLVGHVSGKSYQVVGGNQQIFEQFLIRSKAHVHFNTSIKAISERNPADGTYTLSTASGNEISGYDAVILAVPLQAFQTKPIALPKSVKPIPVPQYHHIHVTYVVGQLRRTIFPSSTAMVFSLRDTPIVQSISLVCPLAQFVHPTLGLFKVFSTQRLQMHGNHRASLLYYFQGVSKVWRTEWDSYPIMAPQYTSDEKFYPPIMLDGHGLYYLNGMERLLSTMETQTISAMNLVRLIRHKHNATSASD